MIPVRENSEVVIIHPDLWHKIPSGNQTWLEHTDPSIDDGNPAIKTSVECGNFPEITMFDYIQI